MNKTIIWVVIIILVIWGVGNLIDRDSKSSGDEIKIGILAPLTGQASVLGERMRNGMELAKEDLISEGIIKEEQLTIIYEDACFPKESLNATRKFIDVEKVKIIGGSFCLVGIDAISPITEANEIIVFNTAANPESVLNKKYLFSTNFSIRDDSVKLANYAYDELDAKTVAIIHFDTSFGESYRDNFTRHFESLGGEVVNAEAKLPDATDFRTDLTKIKANDPDVLLIIHFSSSLGNAIKQARELGLESTIMGDYESEDPTVLEFAGAAAEGLIISSSQPAVKTPEIEAFEQKYLDTYGTLPDVLASNGYDAIRLQVITYLECNGNTNCMAKELHKIENYQGVSGSITINKDNSTEKNTIFKVVKNGEFVEIVD